MSAQSYAEQVAEIATAIKTKAEALRAVEKARQEWTRPEGAWINIGQNTYVVRKDGTVPPILAGVQREVLAALDARTHFLNGELEGLRFKLVKLGREGGAQ